MVLPRRARGGQDRPAQPRRLLRVAGSGGSGDRGWRSPGGRGERRHRLKEAEAAKASAAAAEARRRPGADWLRAPAGAAPGDPAVADTNPARAGKAVQL